jgi:Domain of unknown function (DUF397)
VYPQHLSTATWRKSSYSAENGSCVEVVFAVQSAVPAVGVRDSKNAQAGYLSVPIDQWATFIAAVRND